MAADLKAIADSRGIAWVPRSCRSAGNSRVVVCDARLSLAEVKKIAPALALEPIEAGGAACADVLGEIPYLSWRSTLPWMQDSHYKYLMVSVAMDRMVACIETQYSAE